MQLTIIPIPTHHALKTIALIWCFCNGIHNAMAVSTRTTSTRHRNKHKHDSDELPIRIGDLPPIPSLGMSKVPKYLGLGYDEVARLQKGRAKPDSDIFSELDMNYKGPVIQLEWPIYGKPRYNNTFQWALPENVYVWNSPSCELRENVTEHPSIANIFM
ncbi:putative ubiquitin-conjugating enzyme E2 [Babesia divergens]|uniref:Ubiquitin-conjugating enzyme E2 n=1 Tax=Babesia divergens TaxID=32595 RepID=A0AAD9GJT5_BABDI|nr:putative ubiquitin-conjugating enzyme E2 [Babesia divergens]